MSLEKFKQRILPIKNKLYRFSLRIVGNGPEAEDVVQEVMIKLWDQRDDWAKLQNIEAWSMRLTKNLSIDKLRSKHQRTSALAEGMDVVALSPTPDRVAEARDSLNRVQQLMAALPPKQRQVMELRDLNELSYREIAEALDLSLSQVKVNLHRARQFIKQQLINHHNYGL
ncbi:MAG: RNA polymerase sigma factor [Bacteroidota bacterium]